MAFPNERGSFGDKRVLIKTIQTLNQHLPGRRLSLTELISMEKPGIKGKDNTFFVIDRVELDLLCSSLPRFMWSRLRLPVIIEMTPDYGKGAARIQGEAEVEALAKVLGKDLHLEKSMIIYMPEVRELRRKLPTTTQYAFVTSLRDHSY
ncbi:MAG: DUF61 family protein [Methanotrichaceae archaeon]|nr:DUF61 family protein [Methanotrichaceae archaeon]